MTIRVRTPLAARTSLSRGLLARAARRRGFTLIEVMMALTVLAIGILGIISMQKSAVVANSEAQQFTIATQIARTWLDRLMRDASLWNHPSAYSPTSNISRTFWLNNVDNSAVAFPLWFQPPQQIFGTGMVESPGFDRNGSDLDLTGANIATDVVFCTHVRLRYVFPNDLIRAEVRVFWRKNSLGDGSKFSAYALTSGICGTQAANKVNELGADTDNFHWVYAVSAIPRQGPR